MTVISSSSAVFLKSSVSNTLYLGITSNSDQKSGHLVFASSNLGSKNTTFTTTTCSFNPVVVDSQVSCNGTDCGITSIRLSPSALSILAPLNNTDLETFATSFVNAASSTYQGHYTLVEEYLQGGAMQAGEYDGDADLAPHYEDLPPWVFETRLGLLFNTYWQCAMVPSDQTGSMDHDADTPPLAIALAIFVANASVWRVCWPWLTLLVFSGAVLLIAGIAGAVLAACTVVAGDYIGSESGLALHSIDVEVPEELKQGAVKGVAGRMKTMGNMEVMLQDVHADQDVGKVVLGKAGEDSERVRRSRRYR